jgi:antirestriction protein ArdC
MGVTQTKEETMTKKKSTSRREIDSPSTVRHARRFRRSKAMTDTPHRDAMQEFADRIVTELEKGVKPWVRPWDAEKAGGPQAPFNPVTGKRYHGINVLILGMDMRAFQSGDPRWMTYQQAHEKHWQVRKGEKSTTIFFSKPYEIDDDEADDGKKTIRVLKHYAVFHASQIDGIPAYKAPTVEEAPWTRPEAADIILKNSGAVVRIGGDKAFYSPTTDHIQLPPEHAFRGPPEFAATALHELAHYAEFMIMPRRSSVPRKIKQTGAEYRHNQSDSRKARSSSFGRYRPAGTPTGLVLAMARSFS